MLRTAGKVEKPENKKKNRTGSGSERPAAGRTAAGTSYRKKVKLMVELDNYKADLAALEKPLVEVRDSL